MFSLLCDACSGTTFAASSGPCAQCQANTNAQYQLCDTCAIQADLCQCCGYTLESGYSQSSIDAIVEAVRVKCEAIEVANAAYAAAVEPIKEAVAALTKADDESSKAYFAVVKDADAAFIAAGNKVGEALQRKEGVEEARKAKAEADAHAESVRTVAREALDKCRQEIDAQYGDERKILDAAKQTLRNAKTKAERKCELLVGLIAARHQLEVGYKAELERIEQSEY
ncbi:MAG: hypothetical protein K2W82_16530 [Candidatus Obscuribacterales bacterium]|nr:hypothetical protein [Candidatus Obscuribacterales bacterium]